MDPEIPYEPVDLPLGEDFDDDQQGQLGSPAQKLIDTAENVANRLIRDSRTEPRQMVTLAKSLQAFRKFPGSEIPGHLTFGISYKIGDEEFRELRYYQIMIGPEGLEFNSGGYTWASEVGSDTFSGEKITLGYDGRVNSWSIHDWLTTFEEFLSMPDAEITTEDECDESIFDEPDASERPRVQ